MSALVVKAKTIKDKGIALCHESQGYSANLRPVSLLMKSDLAPEQITKDVVKALRQVTVDMKILMMSGCNVGMMITKSG